MELVKKGSQIAKRFETNGAKGDKEFAFFMQRIQNDQKLQSCTENSLFSVALQIADLGLSFNPAADYVYIIPYGQKAQLQLSYKGLLHLVKKANPELFISSEIVYEGDTFSRKISTSTPDFMSIEYEQGENYGDLKKIKGAFVYFREGKEEPINSVYMSLSQLEQSRKASKAPNSGAWTSFTDEMYRKVVLRRAMKQLSKMPELPEDEAEIKPTLQASQKFDIVIEKEEVKEVEVINIENTENETKK
jgi:recombination protein RecT